MLDAIVRRRRDEGPTIRVSVRRLRVRKKEMKTELITLLELVIGNDTLNYHYYIIICYY